MNISTSPHSPRATALVLGGGGSTGNAWLIGVVAGLADAGVDAASADLTVGTSAGASAAAQLAGATPAELYAGALTPLPRRGPGPVATHMDRITSIIAAATDAADVRRRLGASALALHEATDGSWQASWRATVAARLPTLEWPERRIVITAVDAQTGDPALFDNDSGVDLADAVAASCASGLPYGIADRWYIDGGYRRGENADVARGCERVLVLSPFGGRTLTPPEWGLGLATQVDELRADGSRVETIVPGPDAEHLFGVNAMDLSLRPEAAEAGYRQGRHRAAALGDFWSGSSG